MNTWNIIIDTPRTVYENMALDELLFLHETPLTEQPLIRFYQWATPGITCGYFQQLDEWLRLDLCQAHHVHCTRRLTGGGLTFHGVDIPYSLYLPVINPWIPRDIRSCYTAIHQAISRGVSYLGIPAALAPLEHGFSRGGLCFTHASGSDVVVHDKKIAGSAQRRTHGRLLHQGSIFWKSSLSQFSPYLKNNTLMDMLKQQSISLTHINPALIDAQAIITSLIEGFQEQFSIIIQKISLNEKLCIRATQLAKTKYASDAWQQPPQ